MHAFWSQSLLISYTIRTMNQISRVAPWLIGDKVHGNSGRKKRQGVSNLWYNLDTCGKNRPKDKILSMNRLSFWLILSLTWAARNSRQNLYKMKYPTGCKPTEHFLSTGLNWCNSGCLCSCLEPVPDFHFVVSSNCRGIAILTDSFLLREWWAYQHGLDRQYNTNWNYVSLLNMQRDYIKLSGRKDGHLRS